MRRCLRSEEVSPKVQWFKGSGVLRSKGSKDQDISNSHSNTSLTLKKVHLVVLILIMHIQQLLAITRAESHYAQQLDTCHYKRRVTD